VRRPDPGEPSPEAEVNFRAPAGPLAAPAFGLSELPVKPNHGAESTSTPSWHRRVDRARDPHLSVGNKLISFDQPLLAGATGEGVDPILATTIADAKPSAAETFGIWFGAVRQPSCAWRKRVVSTPTRAARPRHDDAQR
jgi:hypothetical protein